MSIASDNNSNIIKFLTLVGRLKHIKRTGWVMCGVEQPETVAGHMYRMAVMTFLLDDQQQLNKTKCMELALVHDMAECIVGDITPHCGVSAEEKHKREMAAMEELAKLVGSSGSYLFDLFQEYEKQETEESKFVKDLDKFDMILQAFEYEKTSGNSLELQQFFDSTEGTFKHPLVTSLVKEVDKERSKCQSKK